MLPTRASLLLIATLAAAFFADAVYAEDWPRWRGTNRTGTTAESSGWDGERWLAAEPAWSKNCGVGSTSPIVAEGRLYVLGWWEGKDTLLCHDAGTGERLWSQSYDCPQFGRKATGDQGLYSGPTSTPEFDPETKLLYTLGADGDLCCWDTGRKGARVWRLNLYDEFDPPQRPKFGRSGLRDYGYTTAPLVHGEWLLVEVGDELGTVMAFDKRTGKLQWKSQCRDEAGHTGGLVPLTVDGLPCMAVLTCKHLVVTRLDTGHEGKTLGEYPWATDFANNIATPAVVGQDILITSEYNHGTMCKLRATRDGVAKVWEVPYPSKVCSPVIVGDSIYVAWEKLRCLDLATGKLRWEGGRFGDDGSCLATSDGRLVVWGRGTLALCDGSSNSSNAYRELSRQDNLSDTDCWPHVVLAAGRVYCKDRNGRLTCWETRK